MRVTFVSNYINHHQLPVSSVLYEKLGENYTFVQTEPMEEERVRMGWNPEALKQPFVRCFYEEPEACAKLIMDSDVVIFGGTDEECYIESRLQVGRPVIRYSERLYKTGQWKAVSPRGLKKKYHDHTRYRKSPVYLLCSGAYVASDFHIVRAYPDKMFRWGYFPETKAYDIDTLMQKKDPKKILWAARFIDWKHPELVVQLAAYLKEQGCTAQLEMIGNGELHDKTQAALLEKGLTDMVTLSGYKTPEEVRQAMEEAAIYLVTSDRQEGWGAVVNEAMNSGCAVVANRMVGAAPFLIEDGVNGYLYSEKRPEAFFECVYRLLGETKEREAAGRVAYQTITKLWNARTAAERLLSVCEDITAGKEPDVKWQTGPLSRTTIIPERR